MTIKQWRVAAHQALIDAGIDSPEIDTIILLEEVLAKDRSVILAHADDDLTPDQKSKLDELLGIRKTNYPIAYILGQKEFYGLNLMVNESVLIPRPETESLVEYIVKNAPKHAQILDLGTGSGAIALAIKSIRPDLEVSATDVSEDALAIAITNSAILGLEVQFKKSDMFKDISGKFDVIVANLPYGTKAKWQSTQHQLKDEPELALYSSKENDLEHYERFFKDLPMFMKTDGFAVIEHEPDQFERLEALAKQSGYLLTKQTDFVSVIRK